MPPNVPPVLLPKQSASSLRGAVRAVEPAFNVAVRWVLRVLAWLAFGVASYLAWNAINNTSVAGCGVGSNAGCDVVLTSSWSKWLGIPVSVLGLACYATLAALSVLLGLQSARANRAITTTFVTLSMAAAAASIWFIGIQIFVLGHLCQYCLVTDTCGVLLGVIATAFAVRASLAERNTPRPRIMQPGLMALRTAIPGGGRTAPPALRAEPATPSLAVALGAAVPLVALLIGGQMLFAAKTYDVQKVALSESVDLNNAKTDDASDTSSSAKTRVAMRVSADTDAQPTTSNDSTKPNSTASHADRTTTENSTREKKSSTSATPPDDPATPTKQRLVKFLGGTLTLDTYQHPILGSPDAPHIAIEMVSYDCPHCRKMYATMEHALERYGDQVALMIIPVPLDKECNKYVTDPAASHQGACGTAKLAMGIARLNPPAFEQFHDFLMTGKDKPPAMAAIIPKAYVLADRTRLRDMAGSDDLKKQTESYVELFARLEKQSQNKNFGLPVQILGDKMMAGSVEKEEDVFKAWEENLGVKPK